MWRKFTEYRKTKREERAIMAQYRAQCRSVLAIKDARVRDEVLSRMGM